MRSLVCILFVCTVATGRADVSSEDFIEKKIKQGNWSVAGSAELGYASLSGTWLKTSIDGQYFVADRFSVGIVNRLQGSRYWDSAGLGLKTMYHFLETARSTYYLSGEITHHVFDNKNLFGPAPGSDEVTMGTLGIGWNYFITPNVAFGPRLEYTRALGRNNEVFGGQKYQLNIMTGLTVFF